MQLGNDPGKDTFGKLDPLIHVFFGSGERWYGSYSCLQINLYASFRSCIYRPKGKYMPGTHFASSANGNVAEICRLETEIGTFFDFPDGEGGFFPYLNKTTLIIL